MDELLCIVLDDLVDNSLVAIRSIGRIDAILADPARVSQHAGLRVMKEEFRRELDDVAFVFQQTLETNE